MNILITKLCKTFDPDEPESVLDYFDDDFQAEAKSICDNYSKTKQKDTMSKTKLTPLSDRIVVRSVAAENVTASGIILPFAGDDEEGPKRAIVIAVGPGRNGEPMLLKEGDKIIHVGTAGIPMVVDGQEFIVMRQTDALVAYEEA